MGMIFTSPVTEEQRRAAEQKRAARQDEERKTDQDLINAYMLQKLAALEAKNNDSN